MPDILIIEDDLATRTFFARSLSHLGAIDEAERLEDALERVNSKRYDLILVDAHLRGRDGLQVLHHVRKGRQNEKTPAFVVSGDLSLRTRQLAGEHASFFVQKPVRMPVLVMLAAGVLKRDPKTGGSNPGAPKAPVATPPARPSLSSTLSGLFRAKAANQR